MTCKHCNSANTVKYGTKGGNQYYKCNECGRKFAGTDSAPGMRHSAAVIGEAMGLFYEGLSVSDISRHLASTQGTHIDPATAWRWVINYSRKAELVLKEIKIHTSERWVIDETVLKVAGKNAWLWDTIDNDTRFLVGSYLSFRRNMQAAVAVLREAKGRTIGAPKEILSDGLRAYPDAVDRVFGSESKHVRSQGFTAEINTNLIERFQGTVKERTKVMRGLKTLDSARVIADGFILHYNFLRPHMTLKGITPAKAAGVDLPFSTWIELIEYLTRKGV